MQVLDRRKALAVVPFFRLGFRPFFLLGSVLAMLAIPLWIMALNGWFAGWQPTGGWLAWHRHELLFGFAAAIIAGFLLTAVQNWTGAPGLSGKPLMVLTALWVAARLAWLVGAPMWLAVLLDFLFLPLVAAQMARSVWPVRQVRNYPLVVMLTLMAIANGVTLYGIVTGNDQLQRQATVGGVWFVAAIMSMIGGRVIPFFTQRGLLRKEGVIAWPKFDWALLIGTILVSIIIMQGWAMQPKVLIGVVFAALAVGHLIRVVRWYDAGIWRVPLLWSLHLANAWLAVACVAMALWHFSMLANMSIAVHALTVGAMGGLILAMIARVTLGHTGRQLQPPKSMTWAFILFNIGTLARVVVVDWAYFPGLWIAAVCWGLSFAMYLWSYAPMLWQARVDGQPG
ncbi:NnrS family protein [Pseudomonas sp. C27(2019)]|uniref:NnrS family protein n=1 Tax=Pseudomonas sp. C27(2019) TaxID=2604941 RepID=UPI00124786DC|nr:NnrS family protein [Pseudomonas sp. C27(2019)]QEY57809.1 NnrS family protein [Pseudomonas sp. C27(2019)]